MAEAGRDASSLDADIVIIGAGAAGLWCAEVAARGGRDVLLLEKTSRTGTKVLASGGTRCNLTTTLGPREAARLFGPRGERFLRHAFDVLPPKAVRARFEEWGLATEEAPLEKVFPRSGNARDVRDALERAARGAGARLVLDAAVGEVGVDGGRFAVRLVDGRIARAGALVLAVGGRSVPRTGTTGDGYPWLAHFDLPLVTPVPALVPLTSPARWVTELAGIAWQGGEVALVDGAGKVIARRRRPVVFSHNGVSGPGAMDLAAPVARAVADSALLDPSAGSMRELREASQAAQPGTWAAHGTWPLQRADVHFELRLDLWPNLERDGLREALVQLASVPGAPRLDRALGTLLGTRIAEPLPRRLFEAVMAQATGSPSIPRCSQLDRAARHGVVEALRGLSVPVHGTEGWDKAEVTAGGLDLKTVSPRTMAVNAVPGLFVIGELLDVDGPIGGLSFQAAWATAELAGAALAED